MSYGPVNIIEELLENYGVSDAGLLADRVIEELEDQGYLVLKRHQSS